MPRKGRALEQLVAELERVLGPTDVTIQSPEFIIGRNSGKRREVDVSLRTKIGSSAMFVMIECRDRQGRQDVTWIEQVAMKQEDVGANGRGRVPRRVHEGRTAAGGGEGD